MKLCIVHAGPPKTGSSALQDFLQRNREALFTKGVYYPPTGAGTRAAHHEVVGSLVGTPVRPGDKDLGIRTLEGARASRAELVVLSSERTARFLHNRASAKKLIEALRAYDLEPRILFYVRNQPQHLNSSYSQNVKTFRSTLTFPDYIEKTRHSLRARCRYSWWYDVANALQVGLMPRAFIGIARENIIVDFLSACGIEWPLDDVGAMRRNEAVGPLTIAAARALRAKLGAGVQLTHLQGKQCTKALAQEVAVRGVKDGNYSGLTPELASAIEETYRADNRRFAELAWAREWGDVFAEEVNRQFRSNDYLDTGVPEGTAPVLADVVSSTWERIQAIMADQRLGKNADWNNRGVRNRPV